METLRAFHSKCLGDEPPPPTRRPGREPSIGRLPRFLRGRQAVTIFLALSATLVPLLLYGLRGAPLDPAQLLWLVIATLALAAISARIIGTI